MFRALSARLPSRASPQPRRTLREVPSYGGIEIMSTAKATAGADKSAAESSGQYLTFMLAGEEYGVDILRVQEIKGWDKATRMPHTPEYVLREINLRGGVVA